MGNSPDLDKLKQSVNEDTIRINQIFLTLLNELNAYLNLEVINKKFKIHLVDNVIKNRDSDTRLFSYGVRRFIKEDTYHVKLCKDYRNFFPFLLLQSAYLAFVPNNLKTTNLIDFAINQFIEIDLQNFALINL